MPPTDHTNEQTPYLYPAPGLSYSALCARSEVSGSLTAYTFSALLSGHSTSLSPPLTGLGNHWWASTQSQKERKKWEWKNRKKKKILAWAQSHINLHKLTLQGYQPHRQLEPSRNQGHYKSYVEGLTMYWILSKVLSEHHHPRSISQMEKLSQWIYLPLSRVYL